MREGVKEGDERRRERNFFFLPFLIKPKPKTMTLEKSGRKKKKSFSIMQE